MVRGSREYSVTVGLGGKRVRTYGVVDHLGRPYHLRRVEIDSRTGARTPDPQPGEVFTLIRSGFVDDLTAI